MKLAAILALALSAAVSAADYKDVNRTIARRMQRFVKKQPIIRDDVDPPSREP